MNPFRHCVLAGPSVTTAASSFPDGNPLPSVTLDFKTIYTLRPINGRIAFSLTPSSNGVVTMQNGYCSGVTVTTLSPGAGTGLSTSTSTPSDLLYGTIPETRAYGPSQGYGSSAKPAFTAFRSIVAVADVAFTGSSMMNGGSVVVTTTASAMNPIGPVSLTTASGPIEYPGIDTSTAGNISDTVFLPSTTAFPARHGFTLRTMPRSPTYLPTTQNMYSDQDNIPLGYCRLAGSTGDFPGPVYNDAPWKTAIYTGLDATASITVTVRHCVQYAVDDGNSWSQVAGTSAQLRPADLAWYTRVANALPTAEAVGDMAHAAGRAATFASGALKAIRAASAAIPYG